MMSRRKGPTQAWLWIICAVLSSALGCAKDDDTRKTSVLDGDLTDYEKASCQFGLNEGETLAQPDQAAAPDSLRVHFGKTFDASLFLPIKRASAADAVRFAELQGVRIFRMEGATSRCHMFDSLEGAPADFKSHWDRIAAGDGGGRGTLVGMYLERGSPEVPTSGATTALIGVRPDANRWTVMHEYLHHLFQLDPSRQGTSGAELKQRYVDERNELNSLYLLYVASYDVDDFRRFVDQFLKAYRTTRELLTRYFLEEVTIETLLQEELAEGGLGFAPFMETASDGYIRQSAQRANDQLSQLNRMAERISARLYMVDLPIRQRLFAEANSDRLALIEEIRVLKERSGRRLERHAYLVADREDDALRSELRLIAPPCAHSAGLDDL